MKLAFILTGMLALVILVLAFFYLTKQIHGLSFVREAAGENGKLQWLLAAAILAAVAVGLVWWLHGINMIVCLMHLTVIWLVCSGAGKMAAKFGKHPVSHDLIGLAALTVTVCCLVAGWIAAHNVVETDYHFKTQKDVESLRLVLFSDAHVGITFDGDGFAKQMAAINRLNPDVVLIVGDFVDDGTSREDMLEACQALGILESTYGVYFAFGNHDRGYFDAEDRGWTAEELVEALEVSGVKILEDETVAIGDGYYLMGRQDASSNRAPMDELTAGVYKDRYIIVMDHQPGDYDAQAASGVDLVLSGHTHGGQLFPITYVGEWLGMNCRTYGHEKRGDTDFVVTSGIGSWELKFKTGCKSEYVVIDISR